MAKKKPTQHTKPIAKSAEKRTGDNDVVRLSVEYLRLAQENAILRGQVSRLMDLVENLQSMAEKRADQSRRSPLVSNPARTAGRPSPCKCKGCGGPMPIRAAGPAPDLCPIVEDCIRGLLGECNPGDRIVVSANGLFACEAP